jgi:hypothetical protein
MKRMKESEISITVSKVILESIRENELTDELRIEAEKAFNSDPDWEIGESRIFQLVEEQNGAILARYEITVVYDPYFNIVHKIL